MKTLLVTVDSLRYDHYQYMPTTRDFLGESHDRAFATATATLGCFPSIFTGRYNEPHDIDPSQSFVSEINEYTIGITANQLVSERYGYGQPFDDFTSPITLGDVTVKDKVARHVPRGLPYRVASRTWSTIDRFLTRFGKQNPPFRPAEDIINQFIGIDKESWFGWLHFMEPHHPYSPSSESGYRSRKLSRDAIAGENPDKPDEIRRLYKREVQELDEKLKILWESLPPETRIIFTADHGELLGEHGRWGHPGILVPELLRVPFSTMNMDYKSDVISLVDIPSYILKTEFRDGSLSRSIAYASFEDNKCAMDRNHLLSNSDVFAFGDGKDVDPTLHRELNRFETSGVSKGDALEDDLKALGYLE